MRSAISIYTGKRQRTIDSIAQKISVGQRVVKELLEPYLGIGHWDFADNYYTSVDLKQYLLDNDIYTTGTI